MSLKSRIGVTVIVVTIGLLWSVNFFLLSTLQVKDQSEAKERGLNIANIFLQTVLERKLATEANDKVHYLADRTFYDSSVDSARIIWTDLLQKQFGPDRSKEPLTDSEKLALTSYDSKLLFSDETSLKLLIPFITDNSCGSCHSDVDGKALEAGRIVAVASLYLDFADIRRESSNIASNIIIVITIAMIIFSSLILTIIHYTYSLPMKEFTESVSSMKFERLSKLNRRFSTPEFKEVAKQASTVFKNITQKQKESEDKLVNQIQANQQILSMIEAKSDIAHIEDQDDINKLVSKIAYVIDEAERAKLLRRAYPFVRSINEELEIPANPDYIPVVAIYVSEIIAGSIVGLFHQRIELAVDEALSNAIHHGSLEIESVTKEEDFDKFLAITNERMNTAPYKDRVVSVTVHQEFEIGIVTITDEGSGFNYKDKLKKRVNDSGSRLLPHGRGLALMSALASKVEFVGNGNKVILTFNKEDQTGN